MKQSFKSQGLCFPWLLALGGLLRVCDCAPASLRCCLPAILVAFIPVLPIRAQLVSDGATNTLSNITNIIAGGVTVGTNGTSTLLVLADNCLLTNTGLSQIGLNLSARSNEVRLVSATARWLMLNPLSVGVNGSFNRLAVSNGAQVACSQGTIGDSSASASNNTAVVNGTGSVWSLGTSLYVGQIGGGNRLEVSDGGSVLDDHGYIGLLTGGNLALVTGTSSIWSNRMDLTVGALRGGNQLVVSNGGTTFSAGYVLVGDNSSATNNRVMVEGGTLRATNIAGTGVLEVRRGTNVLNSGLVEVDRLLMTNTAGWFEFNGGTLSARNSKVGNGRLFHVGDGSGPAVFTLVGGGGHFFNDGLSVSADGTLTGDGNIGGNSQVTVLSGGTLAPGTGIGKIIVSNTPTLQGNISLEISKTGTVLTNDQLEVAGVLALLGITYGGSLTVSNIGPTALAEGDRFQLFTAGSYAGSFASIALPPLDPGLAWTNKLLVDGSLEVYAPVPGVQTLAASALALTSARLNGAVTTFGFDAAAWFEWGPTTNYGNVTPLIVVAGSTNAVPVSADITGQFQGETNYFRLVATNANGRADGADVSFVIPAFPGPTGVPPLRSSVYTGSIGAYVTYDPLPQWDTAVPMTIEAWVYRQNASRSEAILSHEWPGSYWLGFAPLLRFYRGTNFAELSIPVPAKKWTHVAVSYDGAIARFYINGELQMSQALDNNGAGKLRELRLGYDLTGTHEAGFVFNKFIGNLDEIRLWSVARSQAEIQDGLYREVRGEPGLAAVFPRGGRIEELSGLVGASSGGVTEQIFGMLPRDLVVPLAAVPPLAEGNVNTDSEYAGAEQLALRYPDDPAAPDGVAYFVHTADDLFVGVRGLRGTDAGWDPTNSTLGLFIDPAYERPALAGPTQMLVQVTRDVSLSMPILLNGDGGGGYYYCSVFDPLTGYHPCTPTNLWQAGLRYCDGETWPPCTEFRISRSLLGSFDEVDGVALGHFNYDSFGGKGFEPGEGFPESPATWLTMSYGEGSANLPRVRLSGYVFKGLTNTAPPLPGYLVSLFTSTIVYGQLTDINGRYDFDVPLPTGQFISAQPSYVSFGRFSLPTVSTIGVQPVIIYTNGVDFPPLATNASGTLQLANVNFFVQPPPLPAAILSATPTNPMCGVAVRLDGTGAPGEIVTLFGTNLHSEMEFYLAPVSTTFPNSPDVWTLLPATNVYSDPNGNFVNVRTPFVPDYVREYTNGFFLPSFQSPWRWVAHDSWFRPGRIEYSYFGSFAISPPPYPTVHGFNFLNQESDPSLEEFLATYGWNAYLCVGAAGHCVTHIPNPLYTGIWLPIHNLIIKESHGSCVGMSGTSMLLFNHLLAAQDYDPLALTANGLFDPGLPGEWDTSNPGGKFTRPPIPKDIWARIRMNHGIQMSAEYLNHALSQLSGTGDPVARLPELRAGTTAQTLCMTRLGGGHCVTPYLVEDNFEGNPNITRIWIYDNNHPCNTNSPAEAWCVTNQFIDIDHAANEYIFPDQGWTGSALVTVPSNLYTGEHTAPGLSDIPQLIGKLLMLVAGGADAHLTTPTGGEWGWRPDETFVDNLPDVQSVPILGSPTNISRGFPIFLPMTNVMPDLYIQMRDTTGNIFHVAAGGTMLQLESAAGQPGLSNHIRLTTISNELSSFQFTPQTDVTNIVPRIGFVISSNACAAFQWMGLAGEGGKMQEFRALKSLRAVEYRNETSHPTTHYLRIDAVDGETTNNSSALFGPFTVPAGAVHDVVLQDWPRTRQVRSELDLDANGTPDQVTVVTGTDIDSDGDGMPDAWETLHQLNPNSATGDDGPDADPDQDGIDNYGEYLSGTDPHDPASVLRLEATLLPGNQVRLFWSAVPGRSYEILYADSVADVFQTVPGAGFPRVATDTEEHFDIVLTNSVSNTRFYRLRLQP